MDFREFLNELALWEIQYKVSDWQIILEGGDNMARYHYETLLSKPKHKELRAMLILYAANQDRDLRDLIEERAAIRWADGLPGDLLSAVMCNLKEEIT